MFQRLASSIFIPLALVILMPSFGWGKTVPAANSSQSLGPQPEFDETILTIKRPMVIGNFYVQPGSYIATVNEDMLKLRNMNLDLVAEAAVTREDTNRLFATNKVDLKASNFKDVKAKDLTKLDLGGTKETVVVETPSFVTS